MRTPFARLVGLSILMCVIGLAADCAGKVPPNLNPQATRAWYGTEVIKGLDVIRDAAVAANAVQPPVAPTSDTRIVVEWHQSAVRVIHEIPNGWQPAVLKGLDETMAKLSPSTRYALDPYATLARTLIERSQQ